MKVKPLLIVLASSLAFSCVDDSKRVLPDPEIKVDNSTNGLYRLGASVFANGTGCILRILPEVEDIFDIEPLPRKAQYSVSVSFSRNYEVSGRIGYLDEEGVPVPEVPLERWTTDSEKRVDLFTYYGVKQEIDISQKRFDISTLQHPEEATYILLGVRFHSRFYGDAKALFYAPLK